MLAGVARQYLQRRHRKLLFEVPNEFRATALRTPQVTSRPIRGWIKMTLEADKEASRKDKLARHSQFGIPERPLARGIRPLLVNFRDEFILRYSRFCP